MTDAPIEPLPEHVLQVLVERLGDGLLVTRRDGTILWASAALEGLLGTPPAELIGTNAQDLLHPDDARLSRFHHPDAPVQSTAVWHETRRLRHADGTYRLVDRTAVDLTDEPGIDGWAVIVTRASPRFQAFERERRLAATVEHTQDLVLVYDADLELVYASPSSRRLAGQLEGTLRDHMQRYVDPKDLARTTELIDQLLASPGAQIEARLRIRTSEDERAWVDMRAVNLLDDRAVEAVVLNGRDITAQVALEHQLRHDALHDPLTGLPNRPQLMGMLEAALADPSTVGSTALLYLDLDRFKVVNDSYGHAVGDRVLIDLAGRLRDALGELGTVGRFGGDEYVVLANVAGTEDAIALAQILARETVHPLTVAGPHDEQAEVYLTASIGIALSADAAAASEMLHHADAAMYRAKAQGRAWEVYDDRMRGEAVARISLEAKLARALDDGDFELRYQPIIDVVTREVRSFEALARWAPDGQPVPPSEFVRIAEETGGIHRLGAWALREASQQLGRWLAQGMGPMTVSVNVSPRQLNDPTLPLIVARALDAASLDPALLCLELTETVLVDDLPRAINAIMRLRDLGVHLALDDFGTGWSSLTHLRSVPVDVIKIDKSFIDGVTRPGDDRAIVGALVGMCRALGKRVVAEGVETEAQLEATRELGCHEAQGFLVAEALPAGDVAGWLDRYRVNGRRAPA